MNRRVLAALARLASSAGIPGRYPDLERYLADAPEAVVRDVERLERDITSALADLRRKARESWRR